jgi:hypothetical protein
VDAVIDEDRKIREEKVLETVREWLPQLGQVGTVIQITACDPEKDGALFSVTRAPVPFVCRRGS